MWEVSYTITPDRGYFDRGEPPLWAAGIYFQTIRSLEFVEDGTVVTVYEVDGSADVLEERLSSAPDHVHEYAVCDGDPVVAQIRFEPDGVLADLLSVHRSFGVAARFPLRYVDHDPATVEVAETGPREELRERVRETRELATVDVRRVEEYDPASGQSFRELTDRQQEVLETAVELGYYDAPRGATHEDIAAELDCSTSVVGQHLRRVERDLLTGAVPDAGEHSPDRRN